MIPKTKALYLANKYGKTPISEIVSWIEGMKKLEIYNSFEYWDEVIKELNKLR